MVEPPPVEEPPAEPPLSGVCAQRLPIAKKNINTNVSKFFIVQTFFLGRVVSQS